MKETLKVIAILVLMMVVAVGCGNRSDDGAKAETFPNRSITIIVTTSAGAGNDNQTRIMVPYLQDALGVPINVVNMPGADTEIGTFEIMNSVPDGYTIGATGGNNFPALSIANPDYSFDDFEFIGYTAGTPRVYLAKPNSRFKTMQELVAYAKENPGEITLACSGASHTLGRRDFENHAGIKITQVDFGGGGESQNAVLGGHVEMASLTVAYIDRITQAGGYALAVGGEKRQEAYPDVPTFKELGYDVIDFSSSTLYIAPQGLPDNVLRILRDAFAKAAENEEVQRIFLDSNVYSQINFLVGDDAKNFMYENTQKMLAVE